MWYFINVLIVNRFLKCRHDEPKPQSVVTGSWRPSFIEEAITDREPVHPAASLTPRNKV